MVAQWVINGRNILFIYHLFIGSDHLDAEKRRDPGEPGSFVVLFSCPRKAALACVELLESVRDRPRTFTWHIVCSLQRNTCFFLCRIYCSLARLLSCPIPCCIRWYLAASTVPMETLRLYQHDAACRAWNPSDLMSDIPSDNFKSRWNI